MSDPIQLTAIKKRGYSEVMGKFAVGLIVGGAVVAVLMTWLDRPTPVDTTASNPAVGVDTGIQPSSPMAAPSSIVVEPSLSGNTSDDGQTSAASATSEPVGTASLQAASPSNTPTTTPNPSTPPTTTASVASTEYRPIPIGEDHAEMFDKVAQIGPDTPSTVGELHEQLEQEEEDLSWAYDTEIRMAQFFSLHPSGQMFQIDNIECRSVVCQIQATGFDMTAVSTWGVVMDQMRAEPWANFTSTSTSAGNVGDKFVIVTFLARNVP